MLLSYLTVAWRNMSRRKLYSFLAILGLAVGMATCTMVVDLIRHELSYDRFHEKADRTFRVTLKVRNGESERNLAAISLGVMRALRTRYPEFESSVGLFRFALSDEVVVSSGRDRFLEDPSRFIALDGDFFDVFSFSLVKGNPETALKGKGRVIITESTAARYFGDVDPLGQEIHLPYEYGIRAVVSGVLEDFPPNSHLDFDFLFTPQQEGLRASHFDLLRAHSYVVLPSGVDAARARDKLQLTNQECQGFGRGGGREGITCDVDLQPLAKVHLASHLEGDWETTRTLGDLYRYGGIACVILLIGCLNFINIATVQGIGRAREVGLRKAIGAERRSLILQFYCEATLHSVAALVLAFPLAESLVPFVNAVVGEEFRPAVYANWETWMVMFGVALLVGAVSSSYPSLMLARLRVVESMKGRHFGGASQSRMRKILTVLQFGMATAFIGTAGVAYDQVAYLGKRDLGFEADRILVVEGGINPWNLGLFKSELLESPRIAGVTGVSSSPARQAPPGVKRCVGGGTAPEPIDCDLLFVDADFVELMDLRALPGSGSSESLKFAESSVLINERAAGEWGWTDPIGKAVEFPFWKENRKAQVIGVVKDFHWHTLHAEVRPMVLVRHSESIPASTVNKTFIKLHDEESLPETIALVKEKWEKVAAIGGDFSYAFLEDELDDLYRQDAQDVRIFGLLAGFAMLTACLGLFGLASYRAESRKGEIGIRKVVGASTGRVVFMLVREFGELALVGNLIALPLVYYSMSTWLQNFAYRVDIWSQFLAAAILLGVAVAFVPVAFHSARVAVSNPIDHIRLGE